MAKESFMLVSLKGDKAKKLAQVMANPTCTKILDYLAGKDSTETQIAKELNIPISTVHYNLQQLVEAKLVVVDEFHYSEKGREVNHYKLANKYIIIAPQSAWGLKEKLKSLLPVVPIVGGTALVLEWLSRGFSTARGLSDVSRQIGAEAMQKSIETTTIASSLPMAGAPAVQAVAPSAVQATASPLSEQGIQHVIQATSQAPSLQSTMAFSFFMHPGVFLILGAVIAIGLYFLVDYTKSRKQIP